MSFSKRDGQIKLYGKDNAQAMLESSEAQPSKFLQVMCLIHQTVVKNVPFSLGMSSI